jgi:hypothetical protein
MKKFPGIESQGMVKARSSSSSIQTVLSAPESHQVSFRSRANGFRRITAGREFHPALKILFNFKIMIALLPGPSQDILFKDLK